MKIADLRVQTSTPSNPSPSVVGLYANANSVIVSLVSGGAPSQLGTSYTGSLSQTQIITGQGVENTGVWFGVSGTTVTGLANPTTWLIVSTGGVNLAVPAYALR